MYVPTSCRDIILNFEPYTYYNLASHGDSFTQLDEKKHTFCRRMINSIFSMSQVWEAECYIDNATQSWSSRLHLSTCTFECANCLHSVYEMDGSVC